MGSRMTRALALTAAVALAVGAEKEMKGQGPVLAPGDQIAISVYDHPDLATTLRVPNAGGVDLPLVGAIAPVAGRTLDEIVAEFRGRLLDGYLREAQITASVTAFAPRNAYVLGGVGRPASVPLDPFTRTTALQAIAAAGGFAPDADRANARVLRDEGRTAVPVPADDAAGGDVALGPGDVVVVPRLDRAFVTGQVARPGPIALPSEERLTVTRAISISGGFERFAKQSSVQLIRPGQPPRTLDVRKLLSGKGGEDPELQPGDLVFVPESRW